jgi:hypothetical protein
VILLGIATRYTIRRLKFGRSYFEMETIPGSIGGWLAGTIRTSADLRDAENIRLTLRCVNRVTRGGGDNRSTDESTLWEDEQIFTGKLPGDRAGGAASGTTIPVAFRIPRDSQPTRDSHHDDIIWRLHIRAAMPGADYAADFTVPVFDAEQPETFIPLAEPQAAKLRASRAQIVALDDPQIEISANAAGRKRLLFPASRNLKTAVTLALLALLFGGVAIAVTKIFGSLFFAVVFISLTLVIAYGALLYGFRRVELDIDRHGVKRSWRLLGFSGERCVRATEIVNIEQHKTTEMNSTPYFTIYAHMSDGGKVALISQLRTADAAHVLGEIETALGSPSPARP